MQMCIKISKHRASEEIDRRICLGFNIQVYSYTYGSKIMQDRYKHMGSFAPTTLLGHLMDFSMCRHSYYRKFPTKHG